MASFAAGGVDILQKGSKTHTSQRYSKSSADLRQPPPGCRSHGSCLWSDDSAAIHVIHVNQDTDVSDASIYRSAFELQHFLDLPNVSNTGLHPQIMDLKMIIGIWEV